MLDALPYLIEYPYGCTEQTLNRFLPTVIEYGAALVNTRSTTWRKLGEDERTAPPLDLLRAHPALMKRPLIVADGGMHLGWTKDVQSALGVA